MRVEYDNLCYACSECNGTKRAKRVPLPGDVAYGKSLEVDADGAIHAKDKYGKALIEALDLDAPKYRRMRRRILRTIEAARNIPEILAWCLGYPDDLPDLSKETTAKGNKRPAGIEGSCFERKKRKSFPEYY